LSEVILLYKFELCAAVGTQKKQQTESCFFDQSTKTINKTLKKYVTNTYILIK